MGGHTTAFRALPALVRPKDTFESGCPYDVLRAIVAACLYDVVVVPESLTRYRRHQAQVTWFEDLPPLTRADRLRRRLRQVFVDYEKSALHKAQHASAFRGMCDGLASLGADPALIRYLVGKAAIADFQARLQPSRLRRLMPVLGNLLSGRYHRYENGLSTAARDLLIPAPRRAG